MIPDDAIEAGAAALFEREYAPEGKRWRDLLAEPWEAALADEYRAQARVCITAALAGDPTECEAWIVRTVAAECSDAIAGKKQSEKATNAFRVTRALAKAVRETPIPSRPEYRSDPSSADTRLGDGQ